MTEDESAVYFSGRFYQMWVVVKRMQQQVWADNLWTVPNSMNGGRRAALQDCFFFPSKPFSEFTWDAFRAGGLKVWILQPFAVTCSSAAFRRWTKHPSITAGCTKWLASNSVSKQAVKLKGNLWALRRRVTVRTNVRAGPGTAEEQPTGGN